MEDFNDLIEKKAGEKEDDAAKNASDHFHEEIEGIISPDLLRELSKRNPSNSSFSKTIDEMDKLNKEGLAKPRLTRNDNGKREVYDAGGEQLQRGDFGDRARFEGDPRTGDREVDAVYDYTGNVRQFYKEVFGRNSIDDNGMKLISRVNYGQNFQNAYWDGVAMTFGRPGANSPFRTFAIQDVTAHEMAHGVTQHEAGTVYKGQSGALNESYSDVFGEMVDQWVNNTSSRDADWIIGKGIWKSEINGKGLRDMLNPGTAYDDARIGKDKQPAHMRDYVVTTKDNGGVHINSGIPNKAFAEFARAVGGNSWEEPGQIWFKARALAGRNPSFAQFAYATVEAAQELGYDSLIPKLEKSWAVVGVKPSATAKDDLTPSSGGSNGFPFPFPAEAETEKKARSQAA